LSSATVSTLVGRGISPTPVWSTARSRTRLAPAPGSRRYGWPGCCPKRFRSRCHRLPLIRRSAARFTT